MTDGPRVSAAALDLASGEIRLGRRGVRDGERGEGGHPDRAAADRADAGRRAHRSRAGARGGDDVRSDNDAATALWRVVGRAPGLDAANARLGLTRTVADARWGLTRTTAVDRVTLLRRIFTPDSVVGDARAYVRELMERVVPEQAWGVPTLADPGHAVGREKRLAAAGRDRSVGGEQHGVCDGGRARVRGGGAFGRPCIDGGRGGEGGGGGAEGGGGAGAARAASLEGLVLVAAAPPQDDRGDQEDAAGAAGQGGRPVGGVVAGGVGGRTRAEVLVAVRRRLEALRLQAVGGLDRGGRVDEPVAARVVASGGGRVAGGVLQEALDLGRGQVPGFADTPRPTVGGVSGKRRGGPRRRGRAAVVGGVTTDPGEAGARRGGGTPGCSGGAAGASRTGVGAAGAASVARASDAADDAGRREGPSPVGR
ncbi:hypothetical protein STENM223S_05585 [Streptomyces tendae]